MKVIGLTGSIGMGKSTTASLFRRLGIPVYDADRMVHSLSAKGGKAFPAIVRTFPEFIKDGTLDRAALGRRAFAEPALLKKLEAILHPRVAAERRRFLSRARAARKKMVVLDIPLLFESAGTRGVDVILVVSAPAFLQKARALARPGMTPEKLAAIRARQMSDAEKRRRADLVLRTGRGKRPVLAQIIGLIERMGNA